MDFTVEFIESKLKEGSSSWNLWTQSLIKELSTIKTYSKKPLRNTPIQQFSLKIAELPRLEFENRYFFGFNFSRIKWNHLDCKNTTFKNCNFSKSDLTSAIFNHCVFENCNFEKSNLINSNLNFTEFNNCNFNNCNLSKSEQFLTVFESCTMLNASLMWSRLIGTKISNSSICNSKIFGASIWDLKLYNSITRDLIISKRNEPEIKIDNIEIAQFIYLLLNNQKLRDVITTLTSKIILILGRFTEERLKILESIKESLTYEGFVPILFTFEPSPNRDLTETIQLLANISKLVIADISDPKSIPQELSHIIQTIPSLPIQPIIVFGQREYSMFEHWTRYSWVRPIFEYRNENHLKNEIKHLVK